MRAWWAVSFLFTLWTDHRTLPVTGILPVVRGQRIDDDSIDDKFLTDDRVVDDDPYRGPCDVSGNLHQKGLGSSPPPAARFPPLLLIGGFLLSPFCLLTNREYRRVWAFQQARRLCWLGLNRGCICRESGLIRAIQNNQDATLCYNAPVAVSKEIDVTGKSFNISCRARQHNQCRITGNLQTRLFKGSPKQASFHQLHIGQFSADDGGIALLTGGRTKFESCVVYNSKATAGNGGALSITGGAHVDLVDTSLFGHSAPNGNGGAISITGPKSTLNYDRISLSDNEAQNGGAVYVADGANVTSSTFFWYISQNLAYQLGGAFYVDHASLVLKGPMRVNLAQVNQTSRRGVLSSVWIADDDDPSLSGTNVECGMPKSSSETNRTRSGYCGLGEFASGSPNKPTQLFQNTNCMALEQPLLGSNSTVLCWKNGTCDPNVRATLAC